MVKTVQGVDPGIGVYGEVTMEDQMANTQTALLHRFATWLVGGFAVMALVLGVVGLYGVVAYSVSQRTREIGVRMALGAQRGSVVLLVMREMVLTAVLGVAVALPAAFGLSRLMVSQLYGVQPGDPLTFAACVLVTAVMVGVAAAIPARRAASVDPMLALRSE
jgi:ABC-type antimicrobial peptide transport system permease subunit